MEYNKFAKILLLSLGFVFIIAACGNSDINSLPAEYIDDSSSSALDESPSNQESSELELDELPSSSEVSSGEDGVPALGFALGDPELHATDPSTVSFASGQIQVIEFFAFW